MRRISTALATIAMVTTASPSFAQDDSGAGFGAVVGGLVGGAIGAAVSGRSPRAGNFVSDGGGKGKGGGLGQHKQGAAAFKGPEAGNGKSGQGRRKQGK